ncbi:HYR domain-containing protein [Candidatus Nitrosotenuis cloacae]|uniref:HYR domain-containing protein n=1 Tax=Candidatus Nitrosotenuis cloacae TaxID=1603555 RepID=UPI00069B79EB|nr:HYR domain-containing protein [Candidatus Nitrosotenuis cloacae]
MQLKIATLAAFFVFTLIFSQSAMAASYPYVDSFGSQGLVKTGAFTYPQYAAVDESGNIYVTDLGNARVQKFDNDGEFLHSWGSKGTGKSEFHAPAGIAVGGSYVYVTDHELNVIKKFDLNGNFISSWGSTGTEAGKLKLPNGIAVSKDDFVYVVDTANARVQKFDSSGKFVSIIGSSGTGDGKFLTPLGIAVDSDGNIFVADSGNNRIQKFNSNGVFVVSYNAASGGIKISPDGIDVDSSGNIIVADAGGSRIVVLDKDGNTITSFGKAGSGNSQFKLPKDVALDSDGDLFVVDSSNHRIQKFGSKDTQATSTQTTQTKTPQKPIANDLKKPTVNPPKDLYVEASGGLTRVSIGQAIANDESGIKSITSNAPEEFPLGITTVIWTAIDNAGNMGIATQTITVGDSTPPVISGLTDITLEANGAQNTANLGNPTVNDQVGVLSITNDAPETFSLGQTTITWTAVDVAKNEATYTQTVTVIDTKPPKVRAPAAITSEATSLDQNVVALGEPSITDNSELSSITNDAPEFFPLGETTITWTAIDVAGNVGSATQKITIIDTTAPIISKIAELSVEAVSEKQNPVTLVAPNATDIQAITITNDASTFFSLGQTTITWTAKDSSGNNSTTSQIISVIDTSAPDLSIPADIIQEATGKTGNVISLGEPTATDATGVSSISHNGPSDYPFGSTIITWTATDSFGNSISKNQNVTIIDTTKPNISAPSDVTFEATSLDQNIITLGEPKTSDLVEVQSITNDAPEAFKLGQTVITWTVTDSSGNTNSATQLITVSDGTAPVISVPANITSEATGRDGTIISIGKAEATDAIGVETITNDAPESFPLGETIVTWTVTDTVGNTSTATQSITITDTTSPTITTPSDITSEATSSSENAVILSLPIATDSVSDVTITNDAPESFPLGETIVTWTATDEASNSATITQKVTITDTTSPTITAPSDITQEATSKLENTVTLETPSVSDNVGIETITNDAPELFLVGETIITWTATDSSGLSASVEQKINIVDTTKPEIRVFDVTIEATSEDKNSVDFGTIKSNDLVEVVSVTNDAPENFKLGVTTVTWTATDEAGNSATATQTITIQDTTAPTITAPSDIAFEATSTSENKISLGEPTTTDSVSDVTITNDAPESFPLGETIVTWIGVDSSGNSVTTTQKVIVTDTVAPSITAPADITSEAISLDDNVVSLGDAQTSDAVAVASVENDAPESFPLGETVITWIVTDSSGNTNSATQKVTITDTTSPTITAPSDITQEATSKLENTVTLETPSVSDNVGIETITNDAPELFPVGETVVTWTAKDSSGNTESVSQKVTLVDTVPPKFTRLADITVEATSKDNNEVSLTTPTVFDILDITSLDNDAPKQFALGETTVTWTATDEAGNSATASQRIIVEDTTIPTITAPADITQEADSFESNAVSLGKADANDLVEVNTITNDAPEAFKLGETIITWTATDSSGNVATTTQKVTITDTTAPKITPPESLSVEATSASENHISLSLPTAIDAVSEVFITNDAPSVFPLGETIVTWTATDEAENSSHITQTITIVDTTAPSLVIPENVVADALSLKTPVSIGVASTTDLTDDTPQITNDAPSVFPLGETIVTWSVEDRFGNALAKTQTVTVEACGKSESSYNVILGKEDDDILVGTNLADLIISLGGDDIITAEKGNDCVLSGDGDDIIYGNEGNDYINGGDGADIIKGQSGEDILIGLTGIDIIDGGDDSDSCIVSEHDDDILIKCE